ncbi:putative secreted protein (Por secretion system target) [Gelidibacter algens]|uniref:Putative secreted protein (Por secretion system target) n=1 Tax=Gelidibacter algens TaxID=49280 RepID=A0A1A7R558_9FLAO|nr:T9SS type A sorting domain-containing protein [Gelidibacter algens]OBX26996.1 hypothetical protein A9996_00995 [Gelidibacter algens]RAJ28064.1 putative secreted protein (Por secretion system target) [Gelidibacter algens]
MKKFFTLLLFFSAVVMHSQDYTNGNLIVSYNVDTNNSGAYRNLSLQEYTTGTTGVINSATAVGAAIITGRMVDDRKAAYEGQINTSEVGNYIVLTGRNTLDGTSAGTARAAALSLVRISKNKTIEYSDFLPADAAFNGGSGRSVASVDGTTFFIATAASSADAGVRLATFGSTSNTSYFPEGARSVGIWNNEVVATGGNDPSTYISGVASTPTTAPTSTAFTGSAAPNNYCGLVLFDVDAVEPGNDLMYVAQRFSGIDKYYKSSGVWTYVSTTSTADDYIGGFTGFQAMTGRIEGDKPVLYVIKIDESSPKAKSTLYQTIDNTPRTGDWTSGGAANPTYTVIATSDAGTNQTFRGVTFAPSSTTLSTRDFSQDAKGLLVYPSPDKSSVVISNNNRSVSVIVFNAIGQKVLSGASDGDLILNISYLKSGIYIVRTSNGETARFVK